MDEFGLRRACQWAGNSPATAMKNYALVRKTDFVDDGNCIQKVDAKSDAINARDTKSDAEPASTYEQKPIKKRTAENQRSLQCVSVDDIGLRTPNDSRGDNESGHVFTPNRTLEVSDLDSLAEQIVATFNADQIEQLYSLINLKQQNV